MSTLLSSWRQFQLFEFTPIKDPNFNTKEPLYSDTSLTAINASDNYFVIAIDSFLKIVDHDLIIIKTFLAYDVDYRITFIQPVLNLNLIVTLAEKQGYPSILKLWDLNKIIQINNDEELKFKYISQIIITNSDNSFPISTFKFNFDLTIFAIGYTNGKVILIRGDVLRDRGSKQRIIYESNDPITGLEIYKNEYLFITTTSKIINTSLINRSKPEIISKSGVDLYCQTFDHEKGQLIVGNHAYIKFYNNYQKIKTINYQINKSKVVWLARKNYLLIISPEESKNKKLTSRVIILDLYNNHSNFNLLIPNAIINLIFFQKNQIYLLSSDGILYRLNEKPINQQIESIIQRDLYPIAYDLAKQNGLPISSCLRIQKLYANHLYQNSKFDESIDIYIKCLDLLGDNETEKKSQVIDGSTETETDLDIDDEEFIMNVITKFKDVQNISNLTKFLKSLHTKSLANNDHITLLVCCYCKLKLTNDLDSFIDEFDENLDLDFPLIINLFKECGYFKQVIKLLVKLNQPGSIVDIYLHDLIKPKRALNYIKTLPIDELLLILIDQSKTLLDYYPIETTELLINVFTGKYIPQEIVENDNESQEYSTLNPLTSYHAFVNFISGFKTENEPESKISSEPTYLPPRPSLIFPSFIEHTNEFVIFLEACIETFDKYQGNPNDKKELIMTLLEMYLKLSKSVSDSQHWLKNAEKLIEANSSNIDNSELLLVSHVYGFPAGEVMAQQQAGYEESVFTSYQVAGDVKRCFAIVKKYGDSKPELYKSMIKLTVSSEENFLQLEDVKDFQFLLQKIQQYKLINPLELLQILTGNPQKQLFLTLGLIKDYLIDYIDQQNREIANNTKLMESYEVESTKNSHKLTELTKTPFIIRKTNCDGCLQRLDYPMIHFKCKHSYHQRCINNSLIANTNPLIDLKNSKQCPKCFDEFEEIKSLRFNQFKSKDDFEYFETSLNDAKDKFKFMTDYIGKGVMENDSITLLGE